MDPAKVEADLGLERPKSPHDIQVFLGFSNFYRRFIKNYSKMAAPLINLTRKDVKFKWSHEAEDSFSSLKQAFCSAPILRHFDVSKPGIIEVDALTLRTLESFPNMAMMASYTRVPSLARNLMQRS